MKKIFLIFLIFITTFILSSCGLKSSDKTVDITTQGYSSEVTQPTVDITSSEKILETTSIQTTTDNVSPVVTVSIIDDSSQTITVSETGTTMNDDLNKYEDLLSQINLYQEKFFDLRKLEETSISEARLQISNLFAEVESKIQQNNEYYQKYIKIEPDLIKDNYGYQDVPDDFYPNPVAVFDIQYRMYDELLNDLYSNIETQISAEDFSKLKESEIQWVKEKENFLKTVIPFSGDLSYPIVGEFKVEVTKFRCLLLMLYLDNTIS